MVWCVSAAQVFLLTEDHLRELGFGLVGDRLYFVEVGCPSYLPVAAAIHPPTHTDRQVGGLRCLEQLACARALLCSQVLTQLYDDIVNWSAALGIQLATHPVPPLRKLGLSLNPTSWTVKDVCKVLKAVNLGEYMELFVEHRIQGDVLFSLTEENLREMGVGKVGDRLLITDITQTLYEQITGWQAQHIKKDSPQLLQLAGSA